MNDAIIFGGFAALIAFSIFGLSTGIFGGPAASQNLTAGQIASLASKAGFAGNDLTIAVAIALAESSGNPNANGDTNITPGGSVGLWQIDLAAHPEFSGWDLIDPQQNANAAFSVYQAAGNSFRPWSTFKNNAYASYLVAAQAGAANV